VDEDPELGILIPVRRLEFLERGPCGCKRTARDHRINLADLIGDGGGLRLEAGRSRHTERGHQHKRHPHRRILAQGLHRRSLDLLTSC
jgi:hypothetical protein